MKIRVDSTILQNGIVTVVNGKKYHTVYPRIVWKKFPKSLRQIFADTVAQFFTAHFALQPNNSLFLMFPQPYARSLFHHGLLYSLPEAVLEFPEAGFTTVNLLKEAYNSEFRMQFFGTPYPVRKTNPPRIAPNTCIIPFSFGKDSLFTFAISRELDLKSYPYFFLEPTSPYENKNKRKLRLSFMKEFSVPIHLIRTDIGMLRDSGGLMWGWDMLLTQYTLLLFPYLFAQRPQYLFWSNEQSTSELEKNPEGYLVNPTHEQSSSWTLHLNNLLRSFSLNTTVSSIVEPLHELVILYLLHHRFPEIGKYQLSCFNDTDKPINKRWCGDCFECARIYIFLLAIGIHPERVGFKDNMLDYSKKKLYYLFDEKDRGIHLNIIFQSYTERILSFLFAYRRGVRGALITLFEKQLLSDVLKQEKQLAAKIFRVYEPKTIPENLRKRVLPFYRTEVNSMKKELMKDRLAPVDIS